MERVCFPDGVAGMSKGEREAGGMRVQGLVKGKEEVNLKGSLGTGRGRNR